MTILKWALIFLVVSIIAGLLGFIGISAASADIARVLFYIFVVLFLVLLILGLTVFRAYCSRTRGRRLRRLVVHSLARPGVGPAARGGARVGVARHGAECP